MKCQFCCIVPHLSFVFQVLFSAMPHAFFVHSRALFRVIPSFGEESRVWMLRFAQHDRPKCHSER
ncbi:MAG: hypothetical protein D0433_09940 [Candidatus Thermochlorobacter aerophilum]|uniref:Uncharacterized protein n=1 Tax=Candidatus Thermochlorobacter aerophilus TaxID=1868324 RepID=A0A395LYS2_9BACT|nr:MAG: hypothetical protein D0433_09940 [Candidatus Thermochlorobacter aerophilum]